MSTTIIDHLRGSLVLAVTALLAACASVQPDARMPQVRELTAERVGQHAVWARGPEQARRVDEAVQNLLAQELTAQSAIQIALLNNRDLQAAYVSLGLAQADLVEAGLLDNPVFSLTWYTGSAGSAPEMAVVQDFIGLLSRSARKRVGEAAADAAMYSIAGRVVDVAADAQSQYYTVLSDAQALELAEQVVSATEAAAELAERQRAAGTLNRRDQALQQAFYAQTIVDLAQAQTALASDREKLNRLLGLWGKNTSWQLPQRLPEVPPTLPDLADVESRAIAQRLDLAAAKKEAEAATQAASLARQFRYFGPLGVGVAFKREPGGEHFTGPVVELGLPIFNQNQTRVARAELELERSAQRVSGLAIDIRSQAREARTRVQSAHRVLAHYRKALLPLQDTIVDEMQKQYNGMLVGVYDLLLARQTQVQVARQYVAATRDFWLAWSDLERALGGRMPLATEPTSQTPPAASQPEHQHGADKP
jgi:cobalt-zinc-cadmium efflux system outer membrane protein